MKSTDNYYRAITIVVTKTNNINKPRQWSDSFSNLPDKELTNILKGESVETPILLPNNYFNAHKRCGFG